MTAPPPLYCDQCGYELRGDESLCSECGLPVSLTKARLDLEPHSDPGMPLAPYHKFFEPLMLMGVTSGIVFLSACISAPLLLDHATWLRLGLIVLGLIDVAIPLCVFIAWGFLRRRLAAISHERQRFFGWFAIALNVITAIVIGAALWLVSR